MVCFLLKTYEVVVCLASLRTVKILYTLSCVSLLDMKETGATSRPVSSRHGDIRRKQDLQPPDSSSDILRGSYRFSPQSPASSQVAPRQALDYNTKDKPRCQHIFSTIFNLFSAFFEPYQMCCLPQKSAPRYGKGRAPDTALSPVFPKNFHSFLAMSFQVSSKKPSLSQPMVVTTAFFSGRMMQ